MSTALRRLPLAIAGLIVMASSAAANLLVPLTGFPGHALQSHVAGISADGNVIVGSAPYFNSSSKEAASWNGAGQISLLRPLPSDDGVDRIAIQASHNGSVIVGTATQPDSDPFQQDAFRWTASAGVALLGTLPGMDSDVSYAADVSAIGNIVVGSVVTSTGQERAFRWTEADAMHSLGTLRADDAGTSRAAGISADGLVIVGGAESELGFEPFRWTAEGMVGLGDLPGGYYGGYAANVSADGQVIVGAAHSESSGGSTEAFRWTESTGMQPLGFLRPGDLGSYSIVVSADGAVIFGSSASISDERAFVWDELHGMRDLRQVLENQFGLAPALAGWDLGLVADVSADGLSIVGNGINPAGISQGWLITLDHPLNVPEPTTIAILLTATTFLSLSARKVSRRCLSAAHGSLHA